MNIWCWKFWWYFFVNWWQSGEPQTLSSDFLTDFVLMINRCEHLLLEIVSVYCKVMTIRWNAVNFTNFYLIRFHDTTTNPTNPNSFDQIMLPSCRVITIRRNWKTCPKFCLSCFRVTMIIQTHPETLDQIWIGFLRHMLGHVLGLNFKNKTWISCRFASHVLGALIGAGVRCSDNVAGMHRPVLKWKPSA